MMLANIVSLMPQKARTCLIVNAYAERYFALCARLLRAFYAQQRSIKLGQALF